MSKVAIVTGSSGGIGQEAAAELAQKGYHVVFACRSEEKAKAAMDYAAKAAPGAKTTYLHLDTGKMKTVKAFASAFLEKFDRLDVLVNNAGSGYFLKKDRQTEDGLEAFYATNYLGPFLLTKLLVDVLKKSNGRVVNVTSIEHWEGSYNFEKVTQTTGPASYATSKLMMMLMAFELLGRCGVQGVAVNPGGVMSGIWWYLRGIKAKIWAWVAPLILLNVKQGSATTVHAATADNLPTEACYLSPYKYRSWCPCWSDTIGCFNGPTVRTGDPKAYNKENWKKLWDFSEEQIKPYL